MISKGVRPKMTNITLDWAEFVDMNTLNRDFRFVIIAHFLLTSRPPSSLFNYHLHLVLFLDSLEKIHFSWSTSSILPFLFYPFLFLLLPLPVLLFSRQKDCKNSASDRHISRERKFINFEGKLDKNKSPADQVPVFVYLKHPLQILHSS